MTDLMTVFPVILVEASHPGYLSANGVQFQTTCHLCRESLKTQVWLCFLVLSLLSTCTYAAPVRLLDFGGLQKCLGFENLKKAIEKSDAMLYAPSVNEVKANCRMTSLKCYILELEMVIGEEGFKGVEAVCVWDFRNSDHWNSPSSVDCPPCEAYSLSNITVFLERLNSLIQELHSMQT